MFGVVGGCLRDGEFSNKKNVVHPKPNTYHELRHIVCAAPATQYPSLVIEPVRSPEGTVPGHAIKVATDKRLPGVYPIFIVLVYTFHKSGL